MEHTSDDPEKSKPQELKNQAGNNHSIPNLLKNWQRTRAPYHTSSCHLSANAFVEWSRTSGFYLPAHCMKRQIRSPVRKVFVMCRLLIAMWESPSVNRAIRASKTYIEAENRAGLRRMNTIWMIYGMIFQQPGSSLADAIRAA